MTDLTTCGLIQAERQRQMAKGFDAAHDDRHEIGELALAAAAYCLATIASPVIEAAEVWPFDFESYRPAGAIENLVKAGALIVAEIERLERLYRLIAKEDSRERRGRP